MTYKQYKLFVLVLEAGKSKIKVLALCDEGLLSGSWTDILFLCPPMVEGARELSEASFIRH